MIRRTFHAIVRLLARLAKRRPRLAMRAADLFAPFLPRLLQADAVRAFFPEANAAAIVRAEQRRRMRNIVLMASLLRDGIGPVRTLVEQNGAIAALRAPLVLGTFHVGPFPAMLTVAEQLPGSVFALRREALASVRAANVMVEGTTGDEQHRALSFHRALNQLRGGGFVLMALDPEEATVRLDATFRGHTLHLARGPFALARLARVPIALAVVRWRGADVEIVAGERIDPSGDEQAMAAAAAGWLERYLLDAPEELTSRIVELSTV